MYVWTLWVNLYPMTFRFTAQPELQGVRYLALKLSDDLSYYIWRCICNN